MHCLRSVPDQLLLCCGQTTLFAKLYLEIGGRLSLLLVLIAMWQRQTCQTPKHIHFCLSRARIPARIRATLTSLPGKPCRGAGLVISNLLQIYFYTSATTFFSFFFLKMGPGIEALHSSTVSDTLISDSSHVAFQREEKREKSKYRNYLKLTG